MARVYVLIYGWYDRYGYEFTEVRGVFSTHEKAVEFKDKHGMDHDPEVKDWGAEIEEWEIDTEREFMRWDEEI